MARKSARFKTEYCEQVYRLCLLGSTNQELADFFHVTLGQFEGWRSRHIKFDRAIQEGKHQADGKVVEALFKRAVGYSHPEEKIFTYEGELIRAQTMKHYPPDTAAIMFWLKNRQREHWKDRVEPEMTNKLSEPIEIVLRKADK